MKLYTNDRNYLIDYIQRQQGADYSTRKGMLNNGRKLNRLSTKQLHAKIAQIDRAYVKQAGKYVSFIDSFNLATV